MSQRVSGFKRLAADAYYTPAWATEALVSVAKLDTGAVTLDPAAGGWDMVKALIRSGVPAEGFDLFTLPPYSSGEMALQNFLTWDSDGRYKNVVTNPPYGVGGSWAVRFIEKALEVTKPMGGKVAMLLRVDFDSAKRRRHLFVDHPAFDAKYVLTRRIRWVNLVQGKNGPSQNHTWFLWDWARAPGAPKLGYLP